MMITERGFRDGAASDKESAAWWKRQAEAMETKAKSNHAWF